MKPKVSRRPSSRLESRLLVASVLASCLALAIAVVLRADQAAGSITHTVNGNVEIWRITEPNVKHKILEFQQIRFQPGDKVRVTGGGCVNRGGWWGKTWKRYVDPLPASDQMYHGMVMIPGAIGNLPGDSLDRFARILIIKGVDFDVKQVTEPRKQHLFLGYEDDHYSDNGYSDQDAGTQGQCKIGDSFVEHAFVVVTITHGAGPVNPADLAPFDIAINTVTVNNPQVDDNFILMNAMWGRQITNHELPDKRQCNNQDPYSRSCTKQPTEEDHGFLCNEGTLGIVDGHHNWVAGTYEGTVFWNDKSSWIADGDYNFRITRPDEAGMTTENRIKSARGTNFHSMKMEFSSDETIDHFGTPWWDRFHNAVDDGFSAANGMVVGPDGEAGTFGIVTGLIGLDCPHTCASELHPVWAMAIKVGHDPNDETWAVFVRRHGNEGFCSDHQHILDDLVNDTYTFRLPWRQGATDVGMIVDKTTFESEQGQATGSLSVAKNQGVLLSFTMPTPPLILPNTPWRPEMVNGELHLKWTIPQGGGLHPPIGGGGGIFTDGRGPHPPVAQPREEEPEDKLGRLFASMTPAQRLTLSTKAPQPPSAKPRMALRLAPPTQLAALPVRIARAQHPKARTIQDPNKTAMDQRRLDALHAIYGNQIPGLAPNPVRPRITPRVVVR
jgi:hypothetical protein